MLPTVICRNGELVPADQAAISILTPALYGAFGVYESLQVEAGVVFHLSEHLERLAVSAQAIDLPLPAGLEDMADWVAPLLAANRADSCLLRVTVLGPDKPESKSLAFLWPQNLSPYPPTYYNPGAPAILYRGERALPQVKSLNTLVNYLARRAAAAAGVHEALLLDKQDNITEGSNSNLFVVMDNTLFTAPDEDVLAGVTQQVVMRLAVELGIPLQKTKLPAQTIPHWQEAFITSTSRHVMPLSQIDGKPVGAGQPGPVTKKVREAFERYYGDYIGKQKAEGRRQ